MTSGASGQPVLVTGATGTVGKEVVAALARKGATVVAASRSATRTRFPSDVRCVDITFGDSAAIGRALDGVAAAFVVMPLEEGALAPAISVVDSVLRDPSRRLVLLSARAALWDSRSLLRREQRELEARALTARARVAILRPCSFMTNLLGALVGPEPAGDGRANVAELVLSLGDGRVPFVDPSDLGEAAAAVLLDERCSGRDYVLTGPCALTGAELAMAVAEGAGVPIRFRDITLDEVEARGRARGVPAAVLDAGLAVYARARAGHEAERCGDLAALLGRPPSDVFSFARRNRATIAARLGTSPD